MAQEAGVAFSADGEEQGGMGLAVGDYDADGWLDIFKTNFADDTPNLYHNKRNKMFSDEVFNAGLGTITSLVGWGAGFVDADNDGWLDLLYVNGHVYPEVDNYKMDSAYREPRVLYRNLANGRFENVSAEAGPAFEERYSSRGAAFGDFNNDGRVDVLITNMNDKPSLWRNETSNPNHSILLKLIGTRSNRSAIGARVRVTAGGHAQIGEVHSGDSLMSMSDLRLHFGLGEATKIDTLEVRWPGGQVELLRGVAVDQILELKEGSGISHSERLSPLSLTQPSDRRASAPSRDWAHGSAATVP